VASREGDQRRFDLLRGRKVCVTGRLIAMSRADFDRLVVEHGGRLQSLPTRGTKYLVIGEDGWPAEHDGAPTKAFAQARRLRAYNYPIELLSESAFFERLGLGEQLSAVRGRHTVADLVRLFGISAAQLRRWMRLRLIEPVETVHRLSYFDFHQVAAAKKLCELVREGVGLGSIRAGLEQMRDWLPADALPLAQLAMLEQDGRLLARLDGRLVEPSGQQRFDFDASALEAGAIDAPPAVALPPPPEDIDELFDQALVLEDARRFTEAAALYRRAIVHEPHDAVLHFNLGNVLYELAQIDDARESYGRAIACDANYAEAWNNLGNALADLGERQAAIDAFRQALRLVPDFDAARQNLDATLAEIGPSNGGPQLRVLS
jgi:tetratricopeptide (TPR) repeat protein